MDESDEDIDPIVGPMADFMAEHNLSSIEINIKKPVESITILEQRKPIFDYLSFLNIHLLFKDIFNYILDRQWYYYLNKYSSKLEQEIFINQSQLYLSLKKLFVFFIIYIILTAFCPLTIHVLSICYIFYIFIIDFIFPLLIYYNWFQCLNILRQFINTIQIHQQWLIKIYGFQLIRPSSSLFENQLYQLRRTIFEELKNYFQFSRQIARQYSTKNEQLICYIDLNEFGPLIQSNDLELEKITNQYDQISINSIFKLCHLQMNECIQLIHLNRPKSYWIFNNYQTMLLKSIENLNKTKQNCSIMIDYIDTDKSSISQKFISSYFLLRSNCEQLFEMNETNSIDIEQLKRIIQDLKTVLYSLEAFQLKPVNQTINIEQTSLNDENQSSNISSYHRFDDKIEESIDEILMCDTGKSNDEIINNNNNLDIDDYNQRFLREQTNYLMKELQTAIQGKKQEWNEREQRLLGKFELNEEICEEKNEQIINEESFEKVSSIQNNITMLDELKHSFILNRKKLNINEDIFGEEEVEDEEEENFDDE